MIRGYRRYTLAFDRDMPGAYLKGMILPWFTSVQTAECLEAPHNQTYREQFLNEWGDVEHDQLKRTAAEHLSQYEGEHSGENSCGIYFVDQREDLGYAVHQMGNVEALVHGWGQIAEYAKGFRAQHVRIEHIILLQRVMNSLPYDVDKVLSDLRTRYGCVVSVDSETLPDDLNPEKHWWWGYG